jgi:hypothetical protein
MATIQKRKKRNGVCYRVMIRSKDGFPPKYITFPTSQEAKDFAVKEEAQRREEVYFPERLNNKYKLSELIDQYIDCILPSKPKNAEDTKRQLRWWKERIRDHLLARITSELIAK